LEQSISLISMLAWHLPEVTRNNYDESQFWKPESCWSLNQTTPKYNLNVTAMPILSVKNCSHTEYGAQRTVWAVTNLKQEQQSIPAG